MLFSLIVVVLLLALAFFQSTQGLFSALLMTVFSMCCAALAVGGYEWVAIHYLAPHWRPDYSFAIALAALFGVPLIIFRMAADKLVRRSCLIHSMLDRVGGGFCGLITGYTVMGILTLAVQNIPFGGSIMGFERIVRTPLQDLRDDPDLKPPPPDVAERNLWLNPDRFVVGLASILSSGIFSGERSFGYENPDHVQHLGWINAVPETVPRFAPPGSISIVRTESVPTVFTVTPGGRNATAVYDDDNGRPRPGHHFQMIRVRLHREARGELRSHIFTPRQFRLVGQPGGEGPMKQYHAIAIQQSDATEVINRHIRYTVKRGQNWALVDEPVVPRADNNGEVEIVFELPAGFVPAFLEYKHGARVTVTLAATEETDDSASRDTGTKDARLAAEKSSSSQSAAPSSASDEAAPERSPRSERKKTVDDSGRGGNVRGVTTLVGDSFFGNALPLELKEYQDLNNLTTKRRKMDNGHLVADVQKQAEGTDRLIKSFDVPHDKRLLQLNMTRLHTRSGIGKALARAAQIAQNYFVEDDNGNQYLIVGKYAIANVDGKRLLEVQYFPNQVGTVGGLGKFKKIKDRHLKKDYELVLLFLVDPGATVTSFSSGGSALRRDDLRRENLVAPK